MARPPKVDSALFATVVSEFISNNEDGIISLTMSDREVAKEVSLKLEIEINSEYVRNFRRSQGIASAIGWGGSREGAGRPSQASNIIDSGYALVMANHYRDTYRLSDHRCPSGALSGQTGADKHTPGFGYHTTDLEDAKKRKNNRLARWAQKAGASTITIENHTVTRADADMNNVERLFAEEVKRSSSLYGRTGTQGGKQNTRTAQIFSSL